MGLLLMFGGGGGGAAPVTYATWNPADSGYPGWNFSNGDLTLTGGGWNMVRTTISKDDDEWSVESTVTASNGNLILGVCNASANLATFIGNDGNGFGFYSANGNVLNNSGPAAVYNTWGSIGDKIGLKFNATTMTARWYINGTAQGASALDVSSLGSGPIYVGASCNGGGDVLTLNAGQSSFTHSYGAANEGLFE